MKETKTVKLPDKTQRLLDITGEALEALDIFENTGCRAKFTEWRRKYKEEIAQWNT